MSFPSWNWKGQTLWEMWPVLLPLRDMGPRIYYGFLQRYEPIEDEL